VPVEARDLSSRRRTLRDTSQIGRGLAAAAGFRVATSDGVELGHIDHVRYERRTDYPDEIVVRSSKFFRWRRQVIPFTNVDRVELRTRTVVIKRDGEQID
jgi:PRC-barrel domain